MWRGDALIVVSLLAGVAVASVFTEGGGPAAAKSEDGDSNDDYYSDLTEQQKEMMRQQYLQEIMEEEQRREQEKAMSDEMLKQIQLEQMLAEIGKDYQGMQEDMEQTKQVEEREIDEETLQKIQDAVRSQMEKEEVAQPAAKAAAVVAPAAPAEKEPKQEEEVVEEAEAQPTQSAPTAQKKGQSEFVSFVDPEASRLTKNVPSMEKRRLNEVRVQRLKGDGSLLYLAVGTVMLVGILGGAVGGAVLYRRRRDEPDDQEYAPYAGTGPRSKKPIKGEEGDDTLAYKAQLHHYQQAKQKIICGEENAGVAGDSEDDGDDVDDENNFSVYECPGLAPTGDIEVHNPNFAADSSRQ